MERLSKVEYTENNHMCQKENWSFLRTLKISMKDPNHRVDEVPHQASVLV